MQNKIDELRDKMNKAVQESEKAGSIEVPLVVTCPGAYELKCDLKPKKWSWNTCGHQTRIDDSGNCKCQIDNMVHFIRDVGFKCNNKAHGNEYIKFSATDFTKAIAHAADSVSEDFALSEEEKKKFLKNIMLNIVRNWL